MCVCSLYSTLSNLLLRKGKFIGLQPNPRERERKTQEREKTLDRHWMRDTFVVLAVLRLIAWTLIKLTRLYFIFL